MFGETRCLRGHLGQSSRLSVELDVDEVKVAFCEGSRSIGASMGVGIDLTARAASVMSAVASMFICWSYIFGRII